jgi:hypothetical protein
MAKLPFDDLYLPGPDEPWGVLTWGKSPELVEKDLVDGVARIGGFRSPDYGQSYLRAAKTLLRTARESKTLDHHGLPIFFLQRHAAELIIKAPLQLGLQIQKYRGGLKRPRSNFPVDDEQRKRAEDSHDLGKLLNDLEAMAAVLQVGVIPEPLRLAIAEINAIEQQHTWSRYSFHWEGRKDHRRLVNHMVQEVVLPLVKIQDLLQAASDELGTAWEFDGQMMGNLGELWESLARASGEID